MNKVNAVIEMLDEVDGQLMSIDMENLSLDEFSALPKLMYKINELQKHSVAHFEDLTDFVRKVCCNIEEATTNK